MCVGVTAGSMYVTVSTASLNAAATATVAAVANAEVSAVNIADVTLNAASVELSSGGVLTGRLSGMEPTTGELSVASGVEVSVVAVDGSVATAETSDDGTFQIAGLNPGAYTVRASGPQGHLSYGIRLVSGHNSVAAATSVIPVSKTLDLQLDSALAPPRDLNALQQLLSGIDVAPVETNGVSAPESGSVEYDSISTSSTSSGGSYLGHDQLALNDDGSLDGRVALLDPSTGELATVSDLTAYFIADNQVVARSPVSADGSFKQYNLLPGIYTMVIAGGDATAYIGVDVIGGFASLEEETNYITTSGSAVQQPPVVGAVQGSGGLPGGGGDDLGGFIIEDGGGFTSGGGSIGAGAAAAGEGGGLGLLLAGGLAAGIAAAVDDDNGVASPQN